MGIDLYVGSLSRYFCHDWETGQQRQWREMMGPDATPCVVAGPDGPRAAKQGEEARAIRQIAVRYRNDLGQHLQRQGALQGGTPNVWSESHEAPYFAEPLIGSEYSALLLFAAYDHHPELMPAAIDLERFHEDPALLACADDLNGPFSHLLTGVTLWTPLRLKRPHICPHPNGTTWRVGSLERLAAQLDQLNRNGWNVPEAAVARWLDKPDASTEFEACAQRAFALYSRQCGLAMEHNLCMTLDF